MVLDFNDARIWDASTVASVDSITHRYEKNGHEVQVVGLDPASAHLHDRLSGSL